MENIEKIKEKPKFKIVYCKCGKKIIISACMPFAETDKETCKDIRKYALKGHKIDIVETYNVDDFDRCDCCYPKQLSILEEVS